MKLTVVLAILLGTLALACSTVTPVPIEPTPNIDSIVEAKLKELLASQDTPTPYPTYTQPPSPSHTSKNQPTYTSVPTPTLRPLPTAVQTPMPMPTLVPSEDNYALMIDQANADFDQRSGLQDDWRGTTISFKVNGTVPS